MKLQASKKYIIALLAALGVFVVLVAFYSNAGAATNDPFKFRVWETVQSLSFLFGWISGLPNVLVLLLGCGALLLPSYFTYFFVLKTLNKNERII
ncbi:MAG: hypothetical protein AB3N14_01055 [Flavobacteriaceae bacterium]